MNTHNDKVKSWLHCYKRLAISLKDYKHATFKKGSKVKVDDPRFTGIGEVASQHDCAPENLAVLLENGNVWWYPIERCTPL